jgi:hypothetical protein
MNDKSVMPQLKVTSLFKTFVMMIEYLNWLISFVGGFKNHLSAILA